jgi:hypothetical protein
LEVIEEIQNPIIPAKQANNGTERNEDGKAQNARRRNEAE